MLPLHVSICDSSDEDALLGKSESEEGDDEKLDDYLSMHTDRMHEERGIGGSSSDDLPSTLNPGAPENPTLNPNAPEFFPQVPPTTCTPRQTKEEEDDQVANI